GRTIALADAFDLSVTVRTRFAFAVVNSPTHQRAVAIYTLADHDRVRDYHLRQFDGFIKHHANVGMEQFGLFAADTSCPSSRADPREKQSLGRVDVTHAANLCLIE